MRGGTYCESGLRGVEVCAKSELFVWQFAAVCDTIYPAKLWTRPGRNLLLKAFSEQGGKSGRPADLH